MSKVIVSREARKDLEGIRAYIRDDLANPDAARRIIGELKKSVLSLSSMPGRGKPLDALLPVHTDYRYLMCENYCVFYLTGEAETIVVRILHQRQDCLRALFMLDDPAIDEETANGERPHRRTLTERAAAFNCELRLGGELTWSKQEGDEV